MPHADAATADPLAHSQLQKEEGDANNDQQHQVGHQVGTCMEKRKAIREGLDPRGSVRKGVAAMPCSLSYSVWAVATMYGKGWQPCPTDSATS